MTSEEREDAINFFKELAEKEVDNAKYSKLAIEVLEQQEKIGHRDAGGRKMKGLFIPEITAEMFRNGCLESIEALMAEGEIYDIDYQEPCDDCISREATVKRLCKVADFMNEKRSGLGSPYIMAALFIQDNKDEFPSVTPKEKTGHWVNAKVGKLFPSNDFKCSECGNLLDFDGVNCGRGDANYCPNCGARMTESEDKE